MSSRSFVRVVLLSVAYAALLPAVSYAQASIAGAVKDASGAVLPGVSVEASSPALIEKTRTVLTDGNGQYRIIDLRPGTYVVTFTLSGFNTVKREGIELIGSFTATVNTDLKVGGVEETITVTGESPIVDTQSAVQQRVMNRDVLEAIPTSNTHFSVATLIPAVNGTVSDVGGVNAIGIFSLAAHGGRAGDYRTLVDGLSTASTEGSGQFSGYFPNMSSTQEVVVNLSGGAAESETGGLVLNVTPRDGGNRFLGNFFADGANKSMKANNLSQDLITRGLTVATNLNKVWEASGGAGGPLKKDKLWFYVAARRQVQSVLSGGFTNANYGNPNIWTYAPGVPTTNDALQRGVNGRVTWQVGAKDKLTMFFDDNYRCQCPRNQTSTTSPESTESIEFPYANVLSTTWSSARSSRLLLEAGFLYHPEQYHYPKHDANLIGVVDQSTGLNYRGVTFTNGNGMYNTFTENIFNERASVTYVTGSHAIKVGFANQTGTRNITAIANDSNLIFRFNAGVPNQLTELSDPLNYAERIRADLGIYAQDKWTDKRLTVNYGVRFDYFNNYFPAQSLGASSTIPNRNLTFPQTDFVSWKDLTPRIGAAYDLFGHGKTALKVSLNKYMQAYGLQGLFGDGSNPVNLTTTNVTRAWNDANHNFSPDCDLTNPLANGECGAMSTLAFGQPKSSASVDPAILRGWGKRGYDWEFSTGIQHELLPRLSVDATFFRRWYGDMIAIVNQARTASDYSTFSITAPTNPLLPNGGGYTVGPLYDVAPSKFGTASNLYTFAGNYGDTYEHWNGVDLGLRAQFATGGLIQGGVSTGRTTTNDCALLAQHPEAIWGTAATGTTTTVALANTPVSVPYCSTSTGFVSQFKMSGSYLVPKVGMQASANFQSLPGPVVSASYIVPNATAAASLGRSLSGNAANVTVNLVAPGTYGDRVNQLDLRVGKVLKMRQARTAINVDLYNLFNANPVLTQNTNYAAWQRPQSILQSRFVKLGVQFDF